MFLYGFVSGVMSVLLLFWLFLKSIDRVASWEDGNDE
jgi:hypothetical protein